MPDEKKPDEGQPKQPEGNEGSPASKPNQGPSVEELQKKEQELQRQLKEKDAKIADLETTRATIEARQKQIDDEKIKQNADATLQQRIAHINERRAYDPDSADREMALLLSEVKTQASKDAVIQAQQIIAQQTTIDRLKLGVKSSNPDFDDDVIEVVMERANTLAASGKYRTAEDAVKAATDFVKAKFDGYAQKRNAVPPLPPGAGAEGGGANPLPKAPEPEKEISPAEEIALANEAKRKKLL
jgi:hypothetical protein